MADGLRERLALVVERAVRFDIDCAGLGEREGATADCTDGIVREVAEWLRDLALEQWHRAETHAWPPSRQMAMIRAMWLTDRADELAGVDLNGEQTTEAADG